jgi:hypothetical protein
LDSLFDGTSWGDYYIFSDADCNGSLSAAELSAPVVSKTGSVPNSASRCFVMLAVVPDSATSDDSTLIIVRSLSNYCRADTATAFAHVTVPRLIIQMDIREDTDNDDVHLSYPDSVLTYVIKYWNIGDGLADSLMVVDTLDGNTLLQGGWTLDSLVARMPAGFVRTNFVAEYSIDGTTWQNLSGAAPGNITPLPGNVTVVRFRETGAPKIPPFGSIPADPETANGQGEFMFRVRIR